MTTIKPARRLDNVGEYYFSRKLKEIAHLNAEGADIVSLGIGGPDLPPPPPLSMLPSTACANPTPTATR